MSLTVFGAIWLVACFLAFLSQDMRDMAALTILSMVLQSDNVFSLGDAGVGPQLVTSLLFIIRSLLLVSPQSQIRFNPQKITAGALIGCVVASTYVNGLLNSSYVLFIVQLIIYAVAAMRFYSVRRYLGAKWADGVFRRLLAFVLVVGLLQILITGGTLPKLGVVTQLLYNDPSDSVYFNHVGYRRLFSTFMEPSYCAPFLVGSFYYLLCFPKPRKRDSVMLVVTMIEILLTQSTTAYVVFVAMGFLSLILGNGKRVLKIALPVFVAILIAIALLPNVFQTVIFDKMDSGSALTRSQWNRRALEVFYASPVMGAGYKAVRASSLFLTLLADLGIVGTIVYFAFVGTYFVRFISARRKEDKVQLGSLMLVLAATLCQLFACPDLDFCVFWLSLYLACCTAPVAVAPAANTPSDNTAAGVVR
jgi:hypothetical protein